MQELKLKAGDETELVGESSAMSQIRQAVEKIAPTNSRVFITGPSGSGKEVVARLIHARSRRAANAFVAVNCATMEPDRIETELFGVESADGPRKIGLFELAHNGTLYPRRSRRHAAGNPGQDAARAGGSDLYAGGRHDTRAGRRAGDQFDFDAICVPKSRPANSAKIFITASMSCRCVCRRWRSGATIFRCWSPIS